MSIVTHPIPKIFELGTAICSPSLSVGDCVYISSITPGGIYIVDSCDVFDINKLPAIAIVTQKITSTTCVLQTEGIIENVFASLSPGKIYFVGPNSQPVYPSPVVSAPLFLQKVGLALSSNILRVSFEEAPILRKPL